MNLNYILVSLPKLLDWDTIAIIYSRNFSANKEVKNIDTRIIVDALIIKHGKGKDHRGTIEMIQKNP